MNESVESRLRNFRTAAPPETLRNALLSNLPARRRRHLQQAILRASLALLVLAMFCGHFMENLTAARMIAVMYPSSSTQPAESGMPAWIARPAPLLPLSPRTPAFGNCLMAAAASCILEGDNQ